MHVPAIQPGELVYPIGGTQPKVVLAADKGFLKLADGSLVFERDVVRQRPACR